MFEINETVQGFLLGNYYIKIIIKDWGGGGKLKLI